MHRFELKPVNTLTDDEWEKINRRLCEYQDEFEKDDADTHVIVDNNKQVGVIRLLKDEDKNSAFIDILEIFEECRGGGIGKDFVDYLLPQFDFIEGLATYPSTYFWSKVGVTFADGGPIDIEEAIAVGERLNSKSYAREHPEYKGSEKEDANDEITDENFDFATAFLIKSR